MHPRPHGRIVLIAKRGAARSPRGGMIGESKMGVYINSKDMEKLNDLISGITSNNLRSQISGFIANHNKGGKFECDAREFVDTIRGSLIDYLSEYTNGDLITTYEVASALHKLNVFYRSDGNYTEYYVNVEKPRYPYYPINTNRLHSVVPLMGVLCRMGILKKTDLMVRYPSQKTRGYSKNIPARVAYRLIV